MDENEIKNETSSKRKLWQHPWRYAEGFTIALIILIAGFTIEFLTGGNGLHSLQYPFNIVAGLVVVNFIIVTWIYGSNIKVVKWLSTVPAAISAMALFTFLTLLMGLTQQNDASTWAIIRRLGISHLTSSYVFFLAQLYFLTSLGFVVMRRSYPFTFKNIGFLLNHAGLWIILAAGILGSGDLHKLTMFLEIGKHFNNIAYDQSGNKFEMPFAFNLKDFQVDDFDPKLVIVEKDTQMVLEKGKTFFVTKKGESRQIKDWLIKVDEYYPLAKMRDSVFLPYPLIGASPAAYVHVTNVSTNKKYQGWVSCGSFIGKYFFLPLDNHTALHMLQPQPKKFKSKIEYVSIDKKHDSLYLEVNKPFKLMGWKIYQTGYDESMGRWSQRSTVEVVIDPWLPIVYFGIFLMLAGAIYMFWIGKEFGKK